MTTTLKKAPTKRKTKAAPVKKRSDVMRYLLTTCAHAVLVLHSDMGTVEDHA